MPRYYPNNIFTDCWSSMGNITFFHRDGICYWRTKPQPAFPGTAAQLSHLDIHRRALAAWRDVPFCQKELWREYAREVPSHRPPFRMDNHITGQNLFVSAYHGFARLGDEHIPVPCRWQPFSDFFVEVADVSVEDGVLSVGCSLDIPFSDEPQRYRLLAKLQLAQIGRSYHTGKMRTFLSEETGSDEKGKRTVRFTVEDYISRWELDLPEYTMHARLILIDSKTGYRSRYRKFSHNITIT